MPSGPPISPAATAASTHDSGRHADAWPLRRQYVWSTCLVVLWGLISFPLLIAVQPDNPGVPLNKAAWEKLCRFDKPFLTLFGELDPVAKGWEVRAQASIPGALGQKHQIIPGAGHFIQEDAPDQLVAAVTAFLAVS